VANGLIEWRRTAAATAWAAVGEAGAGWAASGGGGAVGVVASAVIGLSLACPGAQPSFAEDRSPGR
jgi:hypothetical protein